MDGELKFVFIHYGWINFRWSEFSKSNAVHCVWGCVFCHTRRVFVYAKVASNDDDKESQISHIYLNGNASYRNLRQSILCLVPFCSVRLCDCIIHSYANQCKNLNRLRKLTNFNFRNAVFVYNGVSKVMFGRHSGRTAFAPFFSFIVRSMANEVQLKFTVRFEDSSVKRRENHLKFLRLFNMSVEKKLQYLCYVIVLPNKSRSLLRKHSLKHSKVFPQLNGLIYWNLWIFRKIFHGIQSLSLRYAQPSSSI